MINSNLHDLDYLAARLHGRRGGMAEAERLDALCHIRTVNELARQLFPQTQIASSRELQRHLIQQTLAELSELAATLKGPGGAMLQWLRVRYQMENLKVMTRGVVNQLPPEQVVPDLITLPPDLVLPLEYQKPAEGDDPLELLLAMTPAGPLLDGIMPLERWFRERPRPFLLELALDRAYLAELLRLASALPPEDATAIRPLLRHEADGFNLQLALRGAHHYRLPLELLLALYLPGASWNSATFEQLLQMADETALIAAATPLLGKGQRPPKSAAGFEVRYRERWLQLANLHFRQRHMRLGAVIAFATLRRIELANLITLSEGLRLGIDAASLRHHLIPRSKSGGEADV